MKRARDEGDREKAYEAKAYISDVNRHIQQSKKRGDLSEYVRLISKTENGHARRERIRDAMAEVVQYDPDNTLLSSNEFFGLIRDISTLIEPISNSGMTRTLDRYSAHILQRLVITSLELKKERLESYIDFANNCQAAMTFLLSSGQSKTDTGKYILRMIDSFYIDKSGLNLQAHDKENARKLLLIIAKTMECHSAIHNHGDNTLALKGMIRVCEAICEDLKNVADFIDLNNYRNNPDLVRWFMKFEQAIISHNSKQFNEWDKIKLPYFINSLVKQTEVILDNEAHPIKYQSQSQSYVEQLLEIYSTELNKIRGNQGQVKVQREVLYAGYNVDMTLSLGHYICIIEVNGPQHYDTNGDPKPLDLFRDEVIKQYLLTKGYDVYFVHIKSQDIGKVSFGQSIEPDDIDRNMIHIDPLKYFPDIDPTKSVASEPKTIAPSKSKAVNSLLSEHKSRQKTGILRDETNSEGKRKRDDDQGPNHTTPFKH